VPPLLTDGNQTTEDLGHEPRPLLCGFIDPELARDPREEPVGAGFTLKDHHHARFELLLLEVVEQMSSDRALARTVLAEQESQALALANAAQ
jgi:hypothetical protein